MEEAIRIERRALAIDPDLADAHTWLGAALLNLGRVDEAMASMREAIRLEPDNGQAHQALARAYWVGKGDFAAAIPEFERAIALNPDAGYSYLQLGLLLAWEGQYERAEEVCKRAVELQDQYISGNAGLQVVGANGRLGYVYYLQGRYDDALREYERGLAFVGSSDHALKDRTAIELTVKIGAAYHRQGRAAEATRHFERARKMFDSLLGKGADDPFTRYYIAGMFALSGDRDRAFESLERVAAKLPALTAARVRRDPDVETLKADPRFAAIAAAAGPRASNA
jgi:tetratricopeptide (TPR) repeat protein